MSMRVNGSKFNFPVYKDLKDRPVHVPNTFIRLDSCDIDLPSEIRVWVKEPFKTLFLKNGDRQTKIYIELLHSSAHGDYWHNTLFVRDKDWSDSHHYSTKIVDGEFGKEVHMFKSGFGAPKKICMGISGNRWTIRVTLSNKSMFVTQSDIEAVYTTLSRTTIYKSRDRKNIGSKMSVRPINL